MVTYKTALTETKPLVHLVAVSKMQNLDEEPLQVFREEFFQPLLG